MAEKSKPAFDVPVSANRETRVFMYRLYDILHMAEGPVYSGNIFAPIPMIGLMDAKHIDCTGDTLRILADIAEKIESLVDTTENTIKANGGNLRSSFTMIYMWAFDLLKRITNLSNEFLSLPVVQELGDEAGIVQLETGESDEQSNALGAATWALQDFVNWCRSADGREPQSIISQELFSRLRAATALLRDANDARRIVINPSSSSPQRAGTPAINYADYTLSLSKDPQLSTIFGCGKGLVDEHLIRFHQNALVDGKLLSSIPEGQQADALKGKHDIRLAKSRLTQEQLKILQQI